MRSALTGILAFAAGALVPAIVLSLLAVSALRAAPRPDATGDLLMAVTYYGLTIAALTLGFALPTSLSARWRALPPKRAALIAAVTGVTSPVTTVVLLGLIAKALLPLFHREPRLAAGLSVFVPGIVLGAFAVVIARLIGSETPAR